MKLFNLFRGTDQKEKVTRFSDFFLHVSEKKREEVLREAAYKANEEQKETFAKSYSKAETP